MSKFLEGLNPLQQEAVTHETGPLLIIAGPGSGKTRTVAHSIAYAIEVLKEVPNRIAAFTFTRRAKDELEKRVSKIIGNDLANDIRVSTFHSFCGSVVREVLDSFRTNDGRIRAEIDLTQHHIFPENTEEYVIDPYYIDTLKDTLKKSEQLADDDNPFTKVQLSTYALFRDVPEVKTKWQEKFDLIFVDEYQDTDHVQHKIIKALVERHQNLRVVGDDDQGIYGWRDADIQNILDFEKNHPNAKVISLGQNYRSTRQIVNASRALIDFNPDRREKKIFTNNPEGDKVKHLHCEDREAEASTIVGFISRAIQSGWTADDFVVLCRSTDQQAAPFKEAFDNSEILSHVVESSSDMHANSVSIMTIHKSKGLEFKNVFVAGVCSGLLPDYRSKEEDWDEELRLLYVAMTRAENWLCLSSYEEDSSDKNASFKRGPSRFLDFIPQSLVERIKILDNTAIPSRVNKVKDKGEDAEKSPKDATSSPIRHQTVLGIDPGKENVGWSITKRLSDRYTCKYGNERPAGQPIERKINELVTNYSPDAISVEKLEGATDEWFLHVARCVAQIRSVADQRDIECHFYSPQDVKYAVTGNKKASKEEVQHAVRKVCNLKEIPEPHHSADAIATSLCYLRNYLNYSRFQNNARMKEHYDSGTAYLDIRQYNEAIVEFEKAINNAPMIDPMYTKAHCGLARAYLGLGKLEEAENLANEALRLDANYQLARLLLEAIKQAHCNRGRNHLENLRYDEAIAAYEKTINKYHSFTEAYCGLGQAYLGKGNLTAAENSAKEAIRLDPNYQPTRELLENIKHGHVGKGNDYLRQGELDPAQKAAKEVLRLDSSFQPALNLLEDIKQAYYNRGRNHLNSQQYDEAITAFEETTNRYPKFTAAHCGIGQAYLGKGNLTAAEKFAKKTLKLENDYQPALQILESVKQNHYEIGRNYFNQGDLIAAENSAKEAIRLDPNYQPTRELLENIKHGHVGKGNDYLRQGELDPAQKAAKEVLRLDSSFQPALNLLEDIKQAYYNRGRNHLNNQQYDEAITAFKETIDRYPKFTAVHCRIGQAYLGKGNLTAAENSAKEALKLENDYQSAFKLLESIKQKHYELGRDYLNQDDLAKAEKSANHALRLAPNCQLARALLEDIKQAYYNRGCEHLDNQRYEEAIDAFTKTKNKYPDFTEAHYRLAQAYFGQEDLAKAEKSAREALKLEVNYQPALQILKTVKQKHYKDGMSYLERGNLTAAERSANEALRLKPDYPLARALLEDIKQAYYNRGCEHLDNQRYDEAIDTFTKTKNKYPDFAEVHYRLAQAYLEQGDGLAAAEESVKETLRLDPNYQPAHVLLEDTKQEYHNRGIARIEIGEYIGAIDLLLKVNSIDPNNKEVCTNLADVYCLMGDDANAASWYQKVTDIDPNDKIAYIELGNAYYNMGKYEKAVDSFEKASKLDPNCEKTSDYWKRADFKLQKDKEMKADRMIRIPAGEFQMGSNGSESKNCENLAHTIYVDEFYIDINLVTNAQYKVFVDKNPEWQKNCISNWYHRRDYLMDWNGNNYPQGKDNHPVTYVDWYAAMAYALWVRKRLSTEVEWEKAAREFGDTVLVGNYPPDNASSVWEWCLDGYNSNSYRSFSCPNPIVGADNTDGIINNFKNVTTERVLRRGGSIDRRGNTPSFTNYHYGFRCAKTVTD